ncbi:LZTR1 [Symbiodinium sp. CCMP2592]|nr:LZTR1 [Symbiodinium sp. CCMP2592]
MVDAGIADDFGLLTAAYLQQLKEAKGVMLSVCSADYAEMTSSPYSSFAVLKFALDNDTVILPLRVEDIYPPRPPSGEDHPFDKHGAAKGLVARTIPGSRVFLDCRNKTKEQITDEIAKSLMRPKAKKGSSPSLVGNVHEASTPPEPRPWRLALLSRRAWCSKAEPSLREAGRPRSGMGGGALAAAGRQPSPNSTSSLESETDPSSFLCHVNPSSHLWRSSFGHFPTEVQDKAKAIAYQPMEVANALKGRGQSWRILHVGRISGCPHRNGCCGFSSSTHWHSSGGRPWTG